MKIVQPFTVTDTALTSSNVPENEYSAHSLTKVYILGDKIQDVSTHKVYTSKTGSTATVIISIASPGVVTWVGHGLLDGTPISFTSTGTLPTGIVANTVYYVRAPTTNTFNLSITATGANLNTTGTQSGVHTARGSTNYNKLPATNVDVWLESGSTNRWKMFDLSVQSQTTQNGSITVTIATTKYQNTIAFLNLSASSVRVVANHPTLGVVYDVTKTTSSAMGITNLWRYFYTPVRKATDILFEDIPMYANLSFTMTITNVAAPAAVGACIIGQATDISNTGLGVEQGAKLGIQDYSRKEVDDFGNYTVTERAFSRRNDYSVFIRNTDLDFVYNLLSKRRATPTLYIGSKRFGSTMVYGFYKDFSIDISYYDYSVCSITLEGLT